MEPNNRIRRAVATDVSRLVSLHRALVADQAARKGEDRRNAEFDGFAYFERRLRDPRRCAFVAESEAGEVIGYCDGVLIPSRPAGGGVRGAVARLKRRLKTSEPPLLLPRTEGYLANVYVETAHRREGLASTLVRMVVDWLVQGGAEVVHTDTIGPNREARRMFESTGFAVSSIRLTWDSTRGDSGS